MMKNLNEIKSRYFKEPFSKRLGHLASDLLRVSAFLDNPKNITAVNDIIEESKLFIEWTAAEAPFHIQEVFAEIQPKLALWQRHLINMKEYAQAKKALRKSAKEWSALLIKFSMSAQELPPHLFCDGE